MIERLRQIRRFAGRVGILFAISALALIILSWTAPASGGAILAQLAALFFCVWLLIRAIRLVARRAIWRLRNRLLVTYMFIAVVPVLLIAALAWVGGQSVASQLAVYLVTSELDRRVASLQGAADAVLQAKPSDRLDVMRGMADLFYARRYPALEIVLRENGRLHHYPADSKLEPPPEGWQPTNGVLLKDEQFYAWAYARQGPGDIVVLAPLTSEFLAGLVPNLGRVEFVETSPGGDGKKSGILRVRRDDQRNVNINLMPRGLVGLPPAANRFDREVQWFATIPAADWSKPGQFNDKFILIVRSRFSAVLGIVFSRRADLAQDVLAAIFVMVAIAFLIVELISLVIGVGMTRTITRAVHHLYEGTQRVMKGDFSHRIEVKGKDQLAELSHSFNRMTENVERLLIVAKEKERLQSEIEIAREVQSQLYPRTVPEVESVRLAAVCHPARMVSGDYYDYEILHERSVAMAIGDVAGKGISAALLMATLQASLRTQLQNSLELATSAGNGRTLKQISTAQLVSRLNGQLYAYTSPEKYSTFFLGVYDAGAGTLRYTNAGHLPPILIRKGEPSRLDVNGTVVGAFPFSRYDESQIELQKGDLLFCFTDGITEPENEYGEMFGEERLVEIVARNAERPDQEIVSSVIDAVRQWTSTPELQDDMTVLVARRI